MLIATRELVLTYCGHRIWDAYTNPAGKHVNAGGSITVREDYVDRSGQPGHRVTEYRIDAGEGDLRSFAALDGLACGEHIAVSLGVYEGQTGRTWRNALALLPADVLAELSAA